MASRAVVLLTAIIASGAGQLLAQDAGSAPAEPEVVASLTNLTRVETWRFFDPPSPEVNPDYTFFGNRTDGELHVGGARVDLDGAFAYVRAEQLPTRAIGPGGLGTGAFYFAASGLPYSYQVFLTRLTLSVHASDRHRSIVFGRMPYTSGAEASDSLASEAPLASVRRLAVDGRLLGTFDWSFYQRRFDGGRADWRGRRRYAGGSVFLVTQGGYEESANLTMTRLLVGTAYAGHRHGGDLRLDNPPSAESQAFAVAYRDRRNVDIRPDNAGSVVQKADITLAAFGASHVAARRWGPGRADYAAWGAIQLGDWYGQTHRAAAAAVQAGYRWDRSAGHPWVRAGVSYASGDDDPRDDRHQTFFPMLAETRTYAQSMVYTHANLRDLFVQVLAEPHTRVTVRADLHGLALAEARDRWYQGSGATAREGTFFGYSTRPSSGARGLGTVIEGAVDVRLSRFWNVRGYAGGMRGGPVVSGLFTSNRLFFWYVENLLAWRVDNR